MYDYISPRAGVRPHPPVCALTRPRETSFPSIPVVVHETRVRAPTERCFDLARSVTLHMDSSGTIDARAVEGRCHGLSSEGDETVWSARFCGLRFRMATRIVSFAYPTQFGDRLTCGLLRRFEHVYRFQPLQNGGCAMSDELTVEAPFGVFGRLVEGLYLTRRMHQLVQRRLEHIKAVAESEQWRQYLPGT